MNTPNNATHIIFAILIIAFLWTFGAFFDARAQAGPTPTPTPTLMILPTPRPMSVCFHPRYTCVRLPIIRNDEVTGGVR